MADLAKRAAIAAAAAKKKNGTQPGAPTPGGPPDLDNPDEQQRILEPTPIAATVGGQPVEIYPLPFKDVRRMRALMKLVFAECIGTGPVFERITGTLVLNNKLRTEFVYIAARATFPPDATIEVLSNLPAIANEIEEKADMNEFVFLILAMTEKHPYTSNANPK